ncbi:methyltransferase domain-containing protein [Halostreptopolyspora alba]|uniref:Protein-L-isoaspartate O-methyltransferase n=1 Tax=Halostreptopolyspora alba TaxID=2487137 RepID=A0A3N0EH00_9ACTN|nr:methyltransferase domain-containing protein [Nocardiopsaceae bacterium YIM 96095]
MDWQPHARRLADQVTGGPGSRWWHPVAHTPRHHLTPFWWQDGLRVDGSTEPDQWLATAYADTSVITSLGGAHADLADEPDPAGSGKPTSSATAPGLVVRMYRHARMERAESILDVGTGSGYGAALLAARFGDDRVTSIDVDSYLVEAARHRLDQIGFRPRVEVCDATADLPRAYDRIVAMMAMPHIPGSWMRSLRPGGRLVTTLEGVWAIITATMGADGCARGRVEWDRAAFMGTRSASDYSVDRSQVAWAHATDEQVSQGRYPVLELTECWELRSLLEIEAPGITHHYEEANGVRTAVMVHPDGSWARAHARGYALPEVHQGGPRRLWDVLDGLREQWVRNGELPLYGARVFITPDGTCHLARGDWRGVIRPRVAGVDSSGPWRP